MTDTLCIAELADGRRALCYINEETRTAQLVLVLKPEDLKSKPSRPIQAPPPGIPVVDLETGRVIGHLTDARPMHIPPKPQTPRLTPQDLLRMAQDSPTDEHTTRQDKILRDIEDMLDGGSPV